MLDWTEILARQERYRDLSRRAEKRRLIRQVLAGHERHNHLYDRALTWLGRRMVMWGQRLQERYNDFSKETHVPHCELYTGIQ